MSSEPEQADEGGNFDFRIFEERCGQLNARAGHANAVKFLLAGFAADLFDIFGGGIGPRERKLDEAR